MLLFYTILNRGRAFLLIKLILQIMPTISCWLGVGFHLLYVFTNIYHYSGRGGEDRTHDVSNVPNFKFGASQPAAPRLHMLFKMLILLILVQIFTCFYFLESFLNFLYILYQKFLNFSNGILYS